eukprot:SAG31_NODE_38724_length_293_cov_22.376289_1_plen_69_part_10
MSYQTLPRSATCQQVARSTAVYTLKNIWFGVPGTPRRYRIRGIPNLYIYNTTVPAYAGSEDLTKFSHRD